MVADESKLVDRLGQRAPLPVEVLAFARPAVRAAAGAAGLAARAAAGRRRRALCDRRGQPDPGLPARRLVRSGAAGGRRWTRSRGWSSTASSWATPTAAVACATAAGVRRALTAEAARSITAIASGFWSISTNRRPSSRATAPSVPEPANEVEHQVARAARRLHASGARTPSGFWVG